MQLINSTPTIMRTIFCTFVAALTTLLVLATPTTAQNVSTTGQIRGRVLDQAGQAVAQVAVTARNMETGFQRGTETDADGLYTIRLLPPGLYSVTARLIGFQPRTAENVRVVLGGSTPMNFDLSAAVVQLQEMIVTADRPVDVSEGGVKMLVTQQTIEELPSLGRDFVDFINLSGLVAPDPGETTGGQFAIGGQRASQTSVQIDGVDANNSFFGENRGGSRIPFVFSLESIREFQIITNGFDVEYGSYTGGVVNVVTRGGTNRFEGSLYGNFRNDALTAAPFVDDPGNPEITTDYEVQQFAGRFSGPIVRDKAFFLVSVDVQRRREPQLPLTQSRFAPDGARPDSTVFDEIGRYFDILEDPNLYGVTNARSGYQPFETTNDAVTVFGRVDWDLSDRHRLTLRHNFSTFSNDNEWNGNFDFQYGLSRAEKLEDRSHSFVGELQSVLGDRVFNVLRFQFADETRPRQGKDLRPTLSVNLSNGERIRYGGTFASYNNRLDEQKFQVINNFTMVFGDHSVKVGGNLLYTKYFNRFQNFGSQFQGAGEFQFASLDDFENLRPRSYFRPIQEGGGIPTSEFDVVEWSLYLQDEWQVSPKLTATVGLRYDLQTFRDSPQPVVDVERAFGWETGFAPTDNNNISPRFGLAYDLAGDGRSVIRFGAGYFFGRVPGVVGGNVLQTERPVLEVICNGSIVDNDPDAPPSPAGYGSWGIDGLQNPETCASTGAAGVPTYTFWDRDFEYPETFKANVGFEKVLGDRTKVMFDFLFSQSQSLYTVRNLNLRDVQFQLAEEGNRRVFSPRNVFDPTGSNSTNARRSLDFGDVLVNYNDGRARSFIWKAEVNHNFSRGFRVTGSYTHTRAYDNSPYSCCTAGGGYADPTTGAFGPNEIGDLGDTDRAWGPSDFARRHTIIAAGFLELPLGLKLGAFWRSQSGRPYTVIGDDDLNGDGLTGNDRLFIFAPEALPLASTGTAADNERDAYKALLEQYDCVGDYVGQIIPRNTCSSPWTHQFDVRVTWGYDLDDGGRRIELQVDFFNVLDLIGGWLCPPSATGRAANERACGWGRWTGVFGSDRELLNPQGFDSATDEIQYQVNTSFGQEDLLGANLVLQFQTQLGLRFFF